MNPDPPRDTAVLSTSSRRRARWCIGIGAIAVAALAYVPPASADVVILKDGYMLHGKIYKEQQIISDAHAGPIVSSKINGLTLVDDGPRWTIFSATQRQVGDVTKDFDKFARYEVFFRKTGYVDRQRLPSSATYRKETPFDKNWRRVMIFDDAKVNGHYEIKQQITAMTPHFVRIESYTHTWTAFHLTKELGPELVKTLLRTHPDLLEKDGKAEPDKRMRLIRFLIQAEWWDDAEQELDALLKAVPTEKEKVEKVRDEIRELRADLLLDEIKRAKEAGRHKWARDALKRFPQQNVPPRITTGVATLQAEYDAQFKQYESAKRLLHDLIPQIKDEALAEAAWAVEGEVHPDTVGRLEMFATLGEQAEQFAKQGRKALDTPDELLATAVTGWLLGKNSAEKKPSSAHKFWRIRNMVLEYQRTDGAIARRNLLQAFQKMSIPLEFDELAQLISLLPPCEADEDLSARSRWARAIAASTAVFGVPEQERPNKPRLLSTGALPGLREGVDYLLQLPPEYQPGRAYPLLVMLPDGLQKPDELLSRGFGDLPTRHGYITAVLDWHGGIHQRYDPYKAESQRMVTGLLWHLRRKYQVDSDRVFLFGFGEGASAALDVACGHPDLFAGVIPMGPSPYHWIWNHYYWCNLQQLPLYLISGDQVGDRIKAIRPLLQNVMSKGFPSIAVSYKGRSHEWFGYELPFVFEWMVPKKRAVGVPELGKPGLSIGDGQEYRTMRVTDDRFYWLSADEIAPQNVLDPKKGKAPVAARLYAKIMDGNTIEVKVTGLNQVTVWLGKGMVDFAQPIRIRVNSVLEWDNGRKPIVPNLTVLLEDLYERGDRQRPFFEKREFTTKGDAALPK